MQQYLFGLTLILIWSLYAMIGLSCVRPSPDVRSIACKYNTTL